MITNIADLDADQQAALQVKDQSLLLIGCAGSGKTTITAHRIKQAVEALPEGAGPVLALAPTDHTVAELQQQVEILIPEAHGRVRMMTFEDFSIDLPREHGRVPGIRHDLCDVERGTERRRALSAAIDSLHRQAALAPDMERALIEEVVLASPTPYIKDIDHLGWLRSLRAQPTALLHAYTAHQRARKVLDPVALQWSVSQLLTEVPAIAQELRRRYPRVFVDDLHLASCDVFGVLRAWAGDQGIRLDLTLDDDQAPFTYHAITASRLQPFIEPLQMRRCDLAANYCSPAPVVALGNQLLRYREERLSNRPSMRAVRPDTDVLALRVRHFPSWDEELRWVVEDIARRSVIEYDQCAIIVPEGHLYMAIEDTLIGVYGPVGISGVAGEIGALSDVELLSPEKVSGRAFAHIYIVGLAEGLWPPWPTVAIEGMNHELDADRRLLFAAMMAAQESLTLTSSGSVSNMLFPVLYQHTECIAIDQ